MVYDIFLHPSVAFDRPMKTKQWLVRVNTTSIVTIARPMICFASVINRLRSGKDMKLTIRLDPRLNFMAFFAFMFLTNVVESYYASFEVRR